MNYIVLVKQVPDIKNIPEEAWDWEKGILKRGLLDNVCNELDKQALAFALKLRQERPGKIVVLTMGPPFADDVLRYGLSVGADIGVLLTDRKLGGADTAATAYPIATTILKVEKEIFNGDREYMIFTGMQSIDGDTAQVPPEVAEELGIPHIAYATSFNFNKGNLQIDRITRRGTQTVAPVSYPCVVTVTKWTEPPNATFGRTRWARSQKLIQWSAADINAKDKRLGLGGSWTSVFRIFSPRDVSKRTCVFESDYSKLVSLVKETFKKKLEATQETEEQVKYHIPEGKTPTYKGEVWVFAEQEGGQINPASFELLGKATELAGQLNEKVGAVLVGKDIKKISSELATYGANKVYVIEHDLLNDFLPVPYTKAISGLIEQYKPQMMLFSATPLGRELGPRIAYHTNSGLTADCTALDIFDYKKGSQENIAVLRQTRPALGGNIMASIMSQNSKVQMSTVRPGVMRANKPDKTKQAEIIEYKPDLTPSDAGVRIVSTEVKPPSAELSEAVVIVAGGGGCKSRDGYERCIPSLAEHLGKFLGQKAMIAASRVAVESGFIDRSHQVGQTGLTVKPRVYVAAGISGAVQHVTGMQNSDVIIAINKDPNARIFKTADFGIVGSIEEVVPELIKALDSQGA
jgi:electron transfer flavoprotein alpha subunit